MTDAESWVSIARVVRPQGRRGELLADILTDFPERFAQTRDVFLRQKPASVPTPITIEGSWFHKGRIVLKLQAVNSISEAELVRGAEIVIPGDTRKELGEDAAYISDLIGCELLDRNRPGDPVIGTIRDLLQQELAPDLLVVAGTDGQEHSVPFAKAYLLKMDLSTRKIEMQLPPGLLEINAPLNDEEKLTRQREAEAAGSEEATLNGPERPAL